MTEHNGLHTPQDNLPLEQLQTAHPDADDAEEVAAELFANNPAETAYIDVSDVDTLERPTSTDVYQGDADTDLRATEDSYDLLTSDGLRVGETDDVMEAVEEGFTYVPPVDPPANLDPDSVGDVGHGSGYADDDDMTATVRDALRRDSTTNGLVDRVRLAVINGVVVVRGEVDDLEDTDNLIAVISEVEGVEAVRDETTVRGL